MAEFMFLNTALIVLCFVCSNCSWSQSESAKGICSAGADLQISTKDTEPWPDVS